MRFLFVLFLFIIPFISVFSQDNKNLSQVEVSNLSDAQINRIVEEMQKRGLSENDAIALARSRGMSQGQIDDLKKRIADVKSGNTSSSSKETNKTKKKSSSEELEDDSEEDDDLTKRKDIDKELIDTRIFGFSFFNNDKLTFDPSVNIPVGDSYILGSGDELLIDVWGNSQQNYQLDVDKNGDVNIPLVGPVNVGGSTLKDAEKKIKYQLSSIYSDMSSSSPRTFASVRIGQLKAIKVNVVGEVFVPGSYTLPGTATLFNVMYLCGGPNQLGTFRDIQLIRNNKIVARLDVYDFLINGHGDINVALRDGDVVMVPTYINRVKLGGEFKRKGIFEAKDDEKISDVIKFAGGFTEFAYKKNLELYRLTDREKEFRSLTDANLDLISLQNGDSIYVGKVLDRYKNMVTIQGAVFAPGNYEHSDTLSLYGLIQRAGGLKENAYLNRGFINRLKDDFTSENISFSVKSVISKMQNLSLKRYDTVLIRSIDEMQERRVVSIWGEVQKMGAYNYSENQKLGDLVLLAGGFKESASESSIEVMRRLPYDEADKSNGTTSQLFQFKISRGLLIDDEGANFVLKPYDEVFVRYMPGFRKKGSVSIAGQVMYGGIYGLSSRTERISDLVKRAGGLTNSAYPLGAKLTRQYELSDEEKAQREELMRKDSTLVFSSLNFETVAINLVDILNMPGSKDDIFLEDGDYLDIPAKMQTIKVSGEVLNPVSTVYVKGWSAKRYVNNSGGFALNAKKGKTYVIYPNGASAATKSYFFFRKYPTITPGAEVVIPKKPEREGMNAQAWVGIGGSLASIALTIVTIMSINNNKSN
jgi:protein involved in polysaccharide export with SLBB domain